MKTKHLILTLFAALALVFATACSDDDGDKDSGVKDSSTNDTGTADDAQADVQEADTAPEVKACTPKCDPAADPSECPTGTVCLDTGTCAQCAKDADCDGVGSGSCDLASNTCIKCTANDGCSTDVCNMTSNTCAQCSTATACAALSAGNTGVCTDDAGGFCTKCEGATEADANKMCKDAALGALCVQGKCYPCGGDDDCTVDSVKIGTGKCDTDTTHTCTKCEDGDDCPDTAPVCDGGKCVQCTVATEADDCTQTAKGSDTGKCANNMCLGCDETSECTTASPDDTKPPWVCE